MVQVDDLSSSVTHAYEANHIWKLKKTLEGLRLWLQLSVEGVKPQPQLVIVTCYILGHWEKEGFDSILVYFVPQRVEKLGVRSYQEQQMGFSSSLIVTRHFVTLGKSPSIWIFFYTLMCSKASPCKARNQTIPKRMKFLDPKAQKPIFGFLHNSLVDLRIHKRVHQKLCISVLCLTLWFAHMT